MKLTGNRVKIFLKNGTGTEGTVASWTEREVVLTNDQNDDILVIYNPLENIIMFKIYRNLEPYSVPLKREVIPPPGHEHYEYPDLTKSGFANASSQKNSGRARRYT